MCIPGWPRTLYVYQAGLEIVTILLPPYIKRKLGCYQGLGIQMCNTTLNGSLTFTKKLRAGWSNMSVIPVLERLR